MGKIYMLHIDQILWEASKPFTETFITAVYLHTVRSQSGSDVIQKNRFLTKQTVGCDITGVLLYTTRRYNVFRLFAEWDDTLCRERVELLVNEELEWVRMDVAVMSFVYHAQVWSGDIGKQ
jgi:hypothetical protein